MCSSSPLKVSTPVQAGWVVGSCTCTHSATYVASHAPLFMLQTFQQPIHLGSQQSEIDIYRVQRAAEGSKTRRGQHVRLPEDLSGLHFDAGAVTQDHCHAPQNRVDALPHHPWQERATVQSPLFHPLPSHGHLHKALELRRQQ